MGKKRKIIDEERVVYSIDISDIQIVACGKLGRRLSEQEIILLEVKLKKSDYFNWYEVLDSLIGDTISDS